MTATTLMLIVLVAAGTIVTVVMMRSQFQKAPRTSSVHTGREKRAALVTKATPRRNPFRATSISIPEDACAAAQALDGDRFLVDGGEIPGLPLPGCDAAACHCTYLHHQDRRDELAGERRAIGSSSRGQEAVERRHGGERRDH